MDSIDFNEVDISELKYHYSSYVGFVTYCGKKWEIETGPIQLTSYGIPQLDKPESSGYHPDDSTRRFIKIPLDNFQPSCQYLRKNLERLDEFFGSLIVRKKLFGIKSDNYKYDPIIKIILNHDKIQSDYCKIKFITDYHTKENKTIIKKNNEIVEAKTVTEITNYVKFLTTSRFTICVQKIWAHKNPSLGDKFISYSVGLVMNEINVGNAYLKLDKLEINDISTLKKAYKNYFGQDNKFPKDKITIEI